MKHGDDVCGNIQNIKHIYMRFLLIGCPVQEKKKQQKFKCVQLPFRSVRLGCGPDAAVVRRSTLLKCICVCAHSSSLYRIVSFKNVCTERSVSFCLILYVRYKRLYFYRIHARKDIVDVYMN